MGVEEAKYTEETAIKGCGSRERQKEKKMKISGETGAPTKTRSKGTTARMLRVGEKGLGKRYRGTKKGELTQAFDDSEAKKWTKKKNSQSLRGHQSTALGKEKKHKRREKNALSPPGAIQNKIAVRGTRGEPLKIEQRRWGSSKKERAGKGVEEETATLAQVKKMPR